jgi:hypothetical protein
VEKEERSLNTTNNGSGGIRKLIRLRDLIGYLDCGEDIQISLPTDDGWDEFEQLRAGSPLLEPILDWFVTSLGIEKSITPGSGDVIRVSVEDIGVE